MTDSTETQRPPETCHNCGSESVPNASFCTQCGTSLHTQESTESEAEGPQDDDSQTTVAFVPMTDSEQPAQTSPWAPPRSGSAPILDADITETSAIPVSDRDGHEAQPVADEEEPPESVRGFFLGVLAIVLIVAVLAVYVYAAWLSDSARDTVDGWLPWLT